MTLPFYKLQLAGNGFILVDLEQVHPEGGGSEGLTSDLFADAARRICERRFGVGASGAIFLSRDNTIRIFSAQGTPARHGDDALLCAARYAFDTGRITNKNIAFKTPQGEKKVMVLGSHEFKINIGSPFSLLGGRVITKDTPLVVETIERDGVRAAYAAIHVHDDIVVAFPEGMGMLNFAGFGALVQKAFPGRQAIPVVARCVTRETIFARMPLKRDTGCCAAAAASLVAAMASGQCDADAVVIFEQTSPDEPAQNVIARDRDNSRRLAVSWDASENDLLVTGTGGYLFEGKFDLLI
jgi:diaminopimelate epimerase